MSISKKNPILAPHELQIPQGPQTTCKLQFRPPLPRSSTHECREERLPSPRLPMKPLRAFPFPLNIGTDICQISRIYGILNSPRAARFVDRILSPEEQSWNESRLRSVKSFSHKPDSANDSPLSKKDGIYHRDPALWKAAAFIAGR